MLVRDIRTGSGGSSPQGFIAVAGVSFFVANDGANGVELWLSDGTQDETMMVRDIWPGNGSSDPRT